MGIRNNWYFNRDTGEVVRGARILRVNLGAVQELASVRNLGDGEKFEVAGQRANHGDWVVISETGMTIVPHPEFAASHEAAN